jgi:hypothetical protein
MSACDHKRSFMTPCVIEDGVVAFAFKNDHDIRPICVGCGRSPETTGVKAPPDWDKQVAAYLKKEGRR